MKKMKKILIILMLVSPLTSKADNIFGEFKRVPDVIERGFYLGFDFGFDFIAQQPVTTSAANPGFSLAVIAGYDIFKYLSVEGTYMVGMFEAALNDPVL